MQSWSGCLTIRSVAANCLFKCTHPTILQVLSVVLEGNIDQVQYTDRIKAIVEFLGPKLSPEELTNIWSLGEVSGE